VVWLEENTLSFVALDAFCGFFFRISSLAGLQTSIVGGMSFLSVHQLAVAACRYRCRIALFRAFLLQVTASTPHTTGRLLAVSPDMDELLAVVTLRETSQGFVRLYPDCNMAKARQFEYLIGL
jgi:hypothetical protein